MSYLQDGSRNRHNQRKRTDSHTDKHAQEPRPQARRQTALPAARRLHNSETGEQALLERTDEATSEDYGPRHRRDDRRSSPLGPVIVDTNVFVSAFKWQGKPDEVISKLIREEIALIVSEKQLAEIKRVISYSQIGFSAAQQQYILDVLTDIATFVSTYTTVAVITADPSDNMLLEAAQEYKARYIITGDRHLLELGSFKGTKIVSPSEFLQ